MHERQLRELHRVRNNQAIVRGRERAPQFAVSSRWADLSDRQTAALLAGLLDHLADVLGRIDPHIRDIAVRACRDLLGERMDRPAVRRTRLRR